MKSFLSIMSLLFLTLPVLTARADDKTNTYRVPVKKKELLPYAKFEIADAELRLRIKKKRVQAEYTLPDLLTGPGGIKIEAQGEWPTDLNKVVLAGPFADLTCRVNGLEAECDVTYHGLPFQGDTENSKEACSKVRQFLKDSIAESTELFARLEVFDSFSHEAAGILTRLRVRYVR